MAFARKKTWTIAAAVLVLAASCALVVLRMRDLGASASHNPSGAGAGDAAMPETYSMFVFPPTRLMCVRGSDNAPFIALPLGAVVVADPPHECERLSSAYLAAHRAAGTKDAAVPSASGLSLLVAGPLLVGPWGSSKVRRLSCTGREIDLELGYAGSSPAPKAEAWRHLLVVPLLLTHGRYRLSAAWVEETGKVERVEFTCPFDVAGSVSVSQPVRAAGVDFQTVVDSSCRAPAEAATAALHCGLLLRNTTDHGIQIDPNHIRWGRESVTKPLGHTLQFGGGSDKTILYKPVVLPAGSNCLFLVRGELTTVQRDGIRLFARRVGPGFSSYHGLTPGTCFASFDFMGSIHLDSPSLRVRTEPAAFTILP